MAPDDNPSNAPAASAESSADQPSSKGNWNGKNNKRGGDWKKRDKKRGNNWEGDRRNGKPGTGKNGTRVDSRKHERGENQDAAHEARAEKRRRVIDTQGDGSSYMSIPFTEEEIAAEERKPKRKVAVLIGYAGTGYRGLQINHKEKTIEGDLFAAFVKAGAISKANANDPKKSSLVRCARTDKGVHAAGNVLSLKLIIEDENIADKINEHLPEQIRVWGIQRTANSFSAYQACDSRWYEYLMPSYALLPPHPDSFLAKKIVESGEATGRLEEFLGRIDDVKDFWEEVQKNEIQPILDRLDPDLRKEVAKTLYMAEGQELDNEGAPVPEEESSTKPQDVDPAKVEGQAIETQSPVEVLEALAPTVDDAAKTGDVEPTAPIPRELTPVEVAVKEIKGALVAAKRRYRITPARLGKLQAALNTYLGTRNFHNYTVDKSFKDPSAKRVIRSFIVNPTPIPIGDTEWLSLKVHGQSFMMHQIRKMVAMAVMVTRCGAPVDLINQSYEARRISIPKAPGLGLMLERPVFDEYNKKSVSQLGKDKIDFGNFDAKIEEFKNTMIYKRMFEAEEKENAFYNFFHQLDNFRTDFFLWITPAGIDAAYERTAKGEKEKIPKALEAELGNEADGVQE